MGCNFTYTQKYHPHTPTHIIPVGECPYCIKSLSIRLDSSNVSYRPTRLLLLYPQSTLIQPRRLPFYRRDCELLPQRIDASSLSYHIPHHWPNTHLFPIALSHQPSNLIHQHQSARFTLNLRANPPHTPALTCRASEKSGTKFARQ